MKTEMLLKSKPVLSNSQQISRSRSSENLPTSQSQNNIQLVSHTLTIREVRFHPDLVFRESLFGMDVGFYLCLF